MKQVSADYKNQIKEMGREIDSIITYYNHYKMITENNKYILTEDGVRINTEQINNNNITEITAEDIYSVKLITHGAILKTMMKELDFEVKQEMNIGSIVNYKFGVKVNGSYEYVDYGNFIVNEKEYNEDTQTYSYKAYDIMLKSMIHYKDTNTYPTTLYDVLQNTLNYCGINIGISEFPNSERNIYDNPFEGLDITCRDVLDYITEVTGCSSYIENDEFVIMWPNDTKSNNLFDYTNINQKTTEIVVDDEGWITIEYNNTTTTSKNFNYFTKNLNLIPNKNYLIVCEIAEYTYPNSSLNAVSLYYSTPYQGQFTNAWNISNTQLRVGTFVATRTASTYGHWRDINYNNGIRTYFSVPAGQSGKIKFRLSVLEDTSITADTFKYEAYDDLYTLYADSFKDTNVKFNEVFGPVNSILFSRSEDTDVIEIKDEESIEKNGVTQIKIKDNPLLEENDRSDYFEEMFEGLNGLTYTLNDLSSIGITYLDYYDKYKIQIGENTYECLLLNDEINVEQGLTEQIFTEAPEETEEEYRTSRISDKDQKWANIQVKKEIGEITLEVGEKVGKDEVISAINLTPETATIQAEKIKLEGYTTINGGFSIDENGSAKITSENRGSYAEMGDEGFDVNSDSDASLKSSARPTAFTLLKKITIGSQSIWRSYVYISNGGTDSSPYGEIGVQNSSGVQTIYLDGSTGNITCNTVNPSLEEKKKNIEKFNNALDILKDVDIYKYNYKYEEDNTKKRIGFVIGDKYNYREEITSVNNDGADLYSMVSVLWKAVQEQQQQIEELRKLVNK